jgi:hypothetical protein
MKVVGLRFSTVSLEEVKHKSFFIKNYKSFWELLYMDTYRTVLGYHFPLVRELRREQKAHTKLVLVIYYSKRNASGSQFRHNHVKKANFYVVFLY